MSVKIIESKNKRIFEPTKKEGLLCLAVEEIQAPVNLSLDSKFAQTQSRRIAFIFRTQEQFDAIFSAMGVTPAAGTELPGIVVVKEQLEPLSATNPTSGIKYPNAAAKNAGLMCTVGGKPVYRDTFYTSDETIQDILVPHDNGVQIQEFVRSMNAGNKANTPALAGASPVQR
jgi:hypothetical protein